MERWDEQSVVFHRPSGQTHFINSSTAQLLAFLSSQPGSADELIGQFANLLDVQARASVGDYIADLLLRLEELGLIERDGTTDDE